MLKAVSFQLVPPLPAFRPALGCWMSIISTRACYRTIGGTQLCHNVFPGNDLVTNKGQLKGVCWREFSNARYSISRKITNMIPKRFRYRLSTLFVATFVMSLGAAAYGYHLRAVQREEQAFRSIVALGGSIDVRVEGACVYFTDPGGFKCGSGLLRELAAETTPNNFADGHLYLFDDIRRLRYVDFRGSSVTPDSIHQFHRARPACSITE